MNRLGSPGLLRWRWGRVLIGFAAGLLVAWVVNVVVWTVVPAAPARPPQTVEVVIPRGTAERVAAGEAVPTIPTNMVFVVGDVLVLRNEDEVDHQLGSFLVPSRSSISIPMERPSTLSYLCTIHPSQNIGLEVRAGADPLTKVLAVLMLGVPLGLLLGVYALSEESA